MASGSSTAREQNVTNNLSQRRQLDAGEQTPSSARPFTMATAKGLLLTEPPVDQSRYVISAAYGDGALQEEPLVALATSLLSAERVLFGLCFGIYLGIQNDPVNREDPRVLENARRKSERIVEFMEQTSAIRTGHKKFDARYLRTEAWLDLYEDSETMMAQFILSCNGAVAEVTYNLANGLSRLDKAASEVWRDLVDAANSGFLDAETRRVLRQKWEHLQELSDFYHERSGSDKVLPAWHEITAQIFQTAPKPPDQSSNINTGLQTLWLTVAALVCNIATFALSYHYSGSNPGTTEDADFWSLVQSSIMTWFSLLIASWALWKKSTLPRWSWVLPTLVALICSVIALPLYVKAPTAWSTFVSTIASVVQAFMVVQLAFVGE